MPYFILTKSSMGQNVVKKWIPWSGSSIK